MDILYYFVKTTAWLLIQFLQIMMFGRAILSFLPVDDRSALPMFLYTVTEPVIFPVRRILDRFGIGTGLPIDIPFFITFMLLSFLGVIL